MGINLRIRFILLMSLTISLIACGNTFETTKTSSNKMSEDPCVTGCNDSEDPGDVIADLLPNFEDLNDKLNSTQIFKNLSPLQASAHMQKFEVIQPLWSDGSMKTRWIYIPEGKKITFSPTDAYDFPEGTVLVKLFELSNNGGLQKVEIRIMYKSSNLSISNGWRFLTYKWEEDEKDGLSLAAGEDLNITLKDSNLGDDDEIRVHSIPSLINCAQCHNASVGYVRGFRTQQLNKMVGTSNQLSAFNNKKIFDRNIFAQGDSDFPDNPTEASGYPSFVNVYEDSGDDIERLEKQAMTYLSVNCSHCHNSNGGGCFNNGIRNFDLRFNEFDLGTTHTINQIVGAIKRTNSDGTVSGAMPRFTNYPDDPAYKKLAEWVLSF